MNSNRLCIDAHCDAPSQMIRLRDYSLDNKCAQVDFPKMRKGALDASFFAAYLPAKLSSADALVYANELLSELERQVAANADTVAFARNADEIVVNKKRSLISIIPAIENASFIGQDLSLVYKMANRGVRYITLTHSEDNQIADSCTGKGTWSGISKFGISFVKEMNSHNMLIDLAHSSDNTIRKVLEITTRPVLYTHGCCRALASHKRNLSDELIRDIAQAGGLVCISIYPCFLSDEFVKTLYESGLENEANQKIEQDFIEDPSDSKKREAWEGVQYKIQALARPGISRVVDHIEHAVEIAGIGHIGIGTDYDGIEATAAGLEDVSLLPSLWQEMSSRGFSDEEISKIAGINMLRML